MYLFDTFTNFLSGLGVYGRDKMTAFRYTKAIWTREQLESSFQSDWIARKAISIPAHDATREWRGWQAEQPQIELLEETEDRLQIQLKLQQTLTKARLYGGCCMLIGVEGDMASELDPTTIQKDALQFVHVLAPHQIQVEQLVRDISSPYYGQPEFYTLRDESSGVKSVKIHPSRMVRLLGLDTPDPMTNFGWGDPMLQMIHDAVSSAGTVMQSIAALIGEAKVDVIKIPGLTEIFSTADGTQRMIKRFTEANVAKSIINSVLIDGEEEWQRIQVQFNGMPEVLQMYLQIAAGAADIPVTRFLGMSPAGLNATGDADMRNYYDRIASDQQLRLTPALEKLDAAIIASSLGTHDPNIFYEWNSLWQMDDAQKAAIALSKAQSAMIDVNAGLIPLDALVKGRANQLIEDGTYPGLEAAIEESVIDEEMIAEQTEMGHEQTINPPAANENNPDDEEEFEEPQKKAVGNSVQDRVSNAIYVLLDAIGVWKEELHPRVEGGENAGQFGTGSGVGSASKTTGLKRGAGLRAAAKRRTTSGHTAAAAKQEIASKGGQKGKRGKTIESSESVANANASLSAKTKTSAGNRSSAKALAKAKMSDPARLSRSVGFVSPNIRSDLDLPHASSSLEGKQQKLLKRASKDINKKLKLSDASDSDMIGAWLDGAENSLLTRTEGDYDHLALATVMKGHLADQKSVLVFAVEEGGKNALASFNAKGSLDDIHKGLLEDGIENHTIVPTEGGGRVFVFDDTGKAKEAIDKGALRYGKDNPIDVQYGRGKFIGDTEEYTGDKAGTGTDREQRDRARSVYESYIKRSPVEGSDEVWGEVRDAWSASSEALGQKVRNVIEGPQDDDPDEMGRFTQIGGTIDVKNVETKTKASVAKASAAATSSGMKPLPGSKASHPATIASAPITVKGSTPTYRRPEVAGMKLDPERYAHDIGLFSNDDFYPNFGPNELQGDTDQQATGIVQQMKDNLKWLYTFAEPNTMVWYDGARALVDDRVKLFDYSDASVAGVYAALSPTKDWDQNVQLADRVMETYKHKQDFAWDDAMTETGKDIWKGKTKVALKHQAVVAKIKGKTLAECTDTEQKAIWIRTYDQAHNPQVYKEVLPNGALGRIKRNEDEFGTPAKLVWQSVSSVKAAVQVLEANGDRDKINDAIRQRAQGALVLQQHPRSAFRERRRDD